MAIKSYLRECVALEQLEVALRLWETGEDFLSVITLAGAAEEVLGKCLAAEGVPNSLDDLKAGVAAMHRHLYGENLEAKGVVSRANRTRNSLKHFDPSQEPSISLDAREEARDMLNRAMDNYWRLKTSLTPAMERFQRAQRERAGDDG
jgi:hypothetical protein